MNTPAKAEQTKERRSWRSLFIPAVLGFAVLVGLGTWQLERKAWKEALIARIGERLDAPPVALPSQSDWAKIQQANAEYRRVRFIAAFDYDEDALLYGAASAFRPDVSGVGYWVFTPARLADGSFVIVNRGFISAARKERAARALGEVAGPIEMTGVLRWPEARHWFSPHDDPAHGFWYTRDPAAMAVAEGVHPVAPFYVELESPIPPGGWPQPGKIVANLPNNHLQYAVTWYGLALVLSAVFAVWAFQSVRPS